MTCVSTDVEPDLGKYWDLGKANSLTFSLFILKWGLIGSCQRDTGANSKGFQWQSWNNLSNKTNSMVVNENSKYSTNTHEHFVINFINFHKHEGDDTNLPYR